ncbi:MAG: PIN domain-containing protein [Acinetobacter sp.]
MYLLDTNVISELRRPKPHGAVAAWVQSIEDKDLFLSAVTIGEIQAGIEITREQDSTLKLNTLSNGLGWLQVLHNVLPMTADIF